MKKALFLLTVIVFFLTSCGTGEQSRGQQKQGEKETLILVSFEDNAELNKQVALFNKNNDHYQIEIQRYHRSDQPEEDGLVRLQREIMSGKGPDLINFGQQYTTSDIMGKYTEDLLPFLEETVRQNQEDYFNNILEAFYYKEGLYAVPVSFTLETFAGSREALNHRDHWNIQEMMECYQKKQDGMILYPGETKRDVFATILTGSMEYYIDWEKGTCRFDGEEFQKLLQFANQFPDELRMEDDYSVKQIFQNGEALLLPLRLNHIFDICRTEFIFEEEDISYIGFPVEGKSGMVIKPSSPMLAISAGSKHKEASWKLIEQLLSRQYQNSLEDAYPINRSALEEKLLKNREPEYIVDEEGNRVMQVKEQVLFEGEEPIDIFCITEAQADTLLNLIDSAAICAANDYQLYSLILEEADGYFSGDKALQDTVNVIQGRAMIYISEKGK